MLMEEYDWRYGGCGYCLNNEEYAVGEPVLGGGCSYCLSDEAYAKRKEADDAGVEWRPS